MSGHRAGSSHTAAAATPAVGIHALFRQSGVIQCADEDELATTALLLAEQPLPTGPRVAILSNAGGLGCLAADTAERLGLEVPEFSPTTSEAIRRHVQGTIGVSNPVDAGAGISAEDFGAIARTCLASDDVDALLMILVATALSDGSALTEAVASLRSAAPTKPIVLVVMGGLHVSASEVPGVTIQPTLRSAAQALAGAASYADWRRHHSEAPETGNIRRATEARERIAALASPGHHQMTADGWLDVKDAQALLEPYQLAPVGIVAVGRRDILAAAASVGYPIAVKVARGGIVHKTDRDLVRVGLRGPHDLRNALDSFASTLDQRELPILVQPVATGLELALGVVRDPSFGPLLMVGAGGITTDLSDDRTFLIPPITRGDVDRALHSLRLWPLLPGYRGSAPLDVRGVQDTLLRLASLVAEVPEIAEVDINPLIVGAEGCELVDVKVRIGQPGIDAGVPRRLRGR